MSVCPTCHGSGEIPDPKDVACEATLVVGHETFECYAVRAHPHEPHLVIALAPSCCSGYDDHAPDCPSPEVVGGESMHWVWFDDHRALTLAPEGYAPNWIARFM